MLEKIPLIKRLAWIFTFELIKENEKNIKSMDPSKLESHFKVIKVKLGQ